MEVAGPREGAGSRTGWARRLTRKRPGPTFTSPPGGDVPRHRLPAAVAPDPDIRHQVGAGPVGASHPPCLPIAGADDRGVAVDPDLHLLVGPLVDLVAL